jgi:hypothetical protein
MLRAIFENRVTRLVILWVGIYFLMVGVGMFIRVPGSDWYYHWEPRFEINSYPPWVEWLLLLLPDLPFLTGLSLTALGLNLYLRKANVWHYIAAFSSMPLFWTIWLGQIDAVPLLGIAFLPWGMPLVMMKPQVGFWYVWVWWKKRRDKVRIGLGVVAFLAITLIIWGWWPSRFTFPVPYDSSYDLSGWRISPVLGLAALVGAILENDPDRSTALGAIAAPYLQGASYLVLIPTLVRFTGWKLLIAWLTSWASLVVMFLGDNYRPIAILLPITLWILLRLNAKNETDEVSLPSITTDSH